MCRFTLIKLNCPEDELLPLVRNMHFFGQVFLEILLPVRAIHLIICSGSPSWNSKNHSRVKFFVSYIIYYHIIRLPISSIGLWFFFFFLIYSCLVFSFNLGISSNMKMNKKFLFCYSELKFRFALDFTNLVSFQRITSLKSNPLLR